jgi:predicted nucleic acid-binding protein
VEKALGLDSSVLSPFARAGRLDLLAQLTAPYHCVTTEEVLEELKLGRREYPALGDALGLPWLHVTQAHSPAMIGLFQHYTRILGSRGRNRGESSLLAWAELTGHVVLLDDDAAVRAGRKRAVRVLRSLSLVATGLAAGALTPVTAQELVDELRQRGGARFPPECDHFVAWAERQGLFAPK